MSDLAKWAIFCIYAVLLLCYMAERDRELQRPQQPQNEAPQRRIVKFAKWLWAKE